MIDTAWGYRDGKAPPKNFTQVSMHGPDEQFKAEPPRLFEEMKYVPGE